MYSVIQRIYVAPSSYIRRGNISPIAVKENSVHVLLRSANRLEAGDQYVMQL